MIVTSNHHFWWFHLLFNFHQNQENLQFYVLTFFSFHMLGNIVHKTYACIKPRFLLVDSMEFGKALGLSLVTISYSTHTMCWYQWYGAINSKEWGGFFLTSLISLMERQLSNKLTNVIKLVMAYTRHWLTDHNIQQNILNVKKDNGFCSVDKLAPAHWLYSNNLINSMISIFVKQITL